MRASTAGTRLGWLWWLLDPLVMMVIYWLIIVLLFGRDAYAPYPIFVGCALVSWKHFGSSCGMAVRLLRSKHSLIKSVPFPTMVLPISQVLTQFAYLLFGMLTLIVAAMLFGVPMTATLLQLAPLLLLQLMLVTGVALALASFGVLVRDLENLISHMVRVGWYLSPGMYGVDLLARRFAESENSWIVDLYMLNPFAILFTGYRGAIHDPQWLALEHWGVLTVQAAVALVLGYLVFQHYDRRVIKFI